MPEETPIIEEKPVTPSKPVVDLNPKKEIIQIEKKKLIIIGSALAILLLVGLGGFYILGQSSKDGLEKDVKVATKSASPSQSGVIKAKVGQEVETKSGLFLTVEEASYDASYEKQKDDYLKRKIEDWNSYCVSYAGSFVCAKDEANHQQKLEASISAAKKDDDYLNQAYLNVKVAFKNKKDTALEYSPAKFRLKDSFDNQYTAGYYGDDLSILNLNPKETSRMVVSFYVPVEEKDFRLIYENAEISFDVE